MRGVGMRTGTRSLMVLLACCVVGLVISPAGASGEGSSSTGSDSSLSLAGSPLVVGGVQSLDEGQQALNAEEAQRSNPGAVAEREASRTKFEGLDTGQATNLASAAFPGVIDHPAGGPPPLTAGVRSLGFEAANVEQVKTGSGDVGVMQSTVPMATKTSSGAYVPVDLDLHGAGGGFEAANPLVSVRIPKHLGEGVQLPGVGVSLTPVDGQGTPLGGAEGEINGATVDFANTQTDTDTILKPSSLGIDVAALLRSAGSVEALYYKVGLPQGAKLVQATSGESVEVVKEGAMIAQIKPPSATDAAGTPVPVSMVASNDTLTLSVKHNEGSYQYPIYVDPELSGYYQVWSGVVPANWEFNNAGGYWAESFTNELRMTHIAGSYPANDWGDLGRES